MPKLKILSGKDIVKILESFGFSVAGQKGSHIKLKRIVNNIRQTITIPNHQELDKGTTKAIYNQISRYILETELRKYLQYSKK